MSTPIHDFIEFAYDLRDAESAAYWKPASERARAGGQWRTNWLQGLEGKGTAARRFAIASGEPREQAFEMIGVVEAACKALLRFGSVHQERYWPAAEESPTGNRDKDAEREDRLFREQDPHFAKLENEIQAALNPVLLLAEELEVKQPARQKLPALNDQMQAAFIFIKRSKKPVIANRIKNAPDVGVDEATVRRWCMKKGPLYAYGIRNNNNKNGYFYEESSDLSSKLA